MERTCCELCTTRYVGVLLAVVLVTSAGATQSADTGTVRIGLALSGGAALGLAHIGVLKVLEEEGIPVACISGNSMGSMVGGVYAAGYSAAEIESIAVNADWGTLFSSGVPFGARYLPERQQAQRYVIQLRHRNLFPSLPSGLVPLQNVEFLLMDLLSEIEYNTGFDFDNLPTPYRAVAVDLVSGKLQVLSRGRLSQAIRASIAIPGVFAPERLAGMELVDGGVQQYLPVSPLQEFEPDFIIAVLTMKHNQETGISLVDVASRSMDIIGVEDLARQKAMADVLIEPNVDAFTHSDFARARGLIAAGEAAARAALPEIRFKLAGRRPVTEHRKVVTRPLARVGAVRFRGLKVTREAMLRPLVQTRPGSYLIFPRLREDLRRLFNTGLFEDVNYALEQVGPDSVEVTIELEERPYGFFSLGLRYDNVDNVGLGIEVGQGNLWGSGASVRAVVHLGDPNELRLGLTGTRVFNFPFGYRLDVFWNSANRSYHSVSWKADYVVEQRGGLAEAGYILGRNAFFDVGLVACQARYQFPPVRFFDSIPKREWVVGPSFRLESNTYDDLFLPTRGVSYQVNALYSNRAMGSSRHFLKAEFLTARVLRLGQRMRLNPGAEFGVTWGEPVWVERFRSGGDNLPGFTRERFTSPYKAVLKLAVDYRLARLFNQDDYPLYAGLFGNVSTFESIERVLSEPLPISRLHWATGLGLLTNTPVGPLSVTAGLEDPGRAAWAFSVFLSIGREFRYTR